ncbi:protein tyrosine phosphatase-like domain-containing protein [Aspergillus chevalieri]|uniref:Very-long-chain (3R)-3-hydroxyacyl-CoA dehydratase n=1 Tax=Aspergillus chevalieri TaxID=182096 RepID=A0A7R7ZJJ1_ASPCH|nr:uncharacterized protein ACHE_10748A [Aspergillus chevalieri]BCR83346.1 hypothetical protein ACHE_10748A [Aspergillus chevalieri]
MSLTRFYLFTYNALNFILWATSTIYAALLVTQQTSLPAIFNKVYNPYLISAQSLAILEILHSLLGLVRAPVMTTLMQVASRLLLVWGIMYPFGDHGAVGKGIVGGFGEGQLGDYAFLGCLGAWGVTECIRYGFFALQVSGVGVPGWWTWLRYNTFYVLYPLGISSECTMVVKALQPAAELHPAFWWFLVVVLGIYVPGSYILYTHMIAQRRKALKKQKN